MENDVGTPIDGFPLLKVNVYTKAFAVRSGSTCLYFPWVLYSYYGPVLTKYGAASDRTMERPEWQDAEIVLKPKE